MSLKRVLKSYQIITAGVMTGTTTIASSPFDISDYDNVGLQIQWTGTPTGTITVQCSIDGVTYYALTFATAITQPAGAAGGYLIDLNQLPFQFLKVSYTNASGVGAMNVFICTKDVN